MFSGELVRWNRVIIVLVVTDILRLDSTLFILTIDISRAFYGATNDITITYNDNYPRRLMLCQQVHNDRIFRTFNHQGDVRGEGRGVMSLLTGVIQLVMVL